MKNLRWRYSLPDLSAQGLNSNQVGFKLVDLSERYCKNVNLKRTLQLIKILSKEKSYLEDVSEDIDL